MITNACIRSQAERRERLESLEVRKSEISSLAANLPPKRNTRFSIADINSPHYQAYLGRICDYVLCGEGVWYTVGEDYVEFFDTEEISERNSTVPLYHFRSTSMADIKRDLDEKWKIFLQKDNIPAAKLDVYDKEGQRIGVVKGIFSQAKVSRTIIF